MPAYHCPRATCDAEFETSTERVDHLVNDHGEAQTAGEPHTCGIECNHNAGRSYDSDSFEY